MILAKYKQIYNHVGPNNMANSLQKIVKLRHFNELCFYYFTRQVKFSVTFEDVILDLH